MMKTKQYIALALTFLLTLGAMTSCSAKADMEGMTTNDALYDSAYTDRMESSVEKPSSAGGVSVGTSAAEDSLSSASSAEFATKIIKTVKMTTETKEFDRAMTELDRLITENGGFVESSSSNGQSLYNSGVYRRNADYTVRIPAEKLESFLSASRQLLNVTYSHASSQNITTEYYDLQSRLEVLRTERESLNAMLEKADTVENMLLIRDRLYNVIEEIESYETQIRLYDSLVSYSTVYLTVEEVVEYTKVTTEQPGWGTRLLDAFRESWKDFADNFQDFTVGLLYAVPTLMVLGLIATAIALLLRGLIRRQKRVSGEKKTRAKKNGENEPPQS